jgi:hypothetical protein
MGRDGIAVPAVFTSGPFSRRKAGEAIMSIRLYGWPHSTASRVHWALEELA